MRDGLVPLIERGFVFAEPIQEDYGWGFWATQQNGAFWVAISYVGDGPQEEPARWVVSVTSGIGLNLSKRLFYKSHRQTFTALRDQIWQVLRSNTGIKAI